MGVNIWCAIHSFDALTMKLFRGDNFLPEQSVKAVARVITKTTTLTSEFISYKSKIVFNLFH